MMMIITIIIIIIIIILFTSPFLVTCTQCTMCNSKQRHKQTHTDHSRRFAGGRTTAAEPASPAPAFHSILCSRQSCWREALSAVELSAARCCRGRGSRKEGLAVVHWTDGTAANKRDKPFYWQRRQTSQSSSRARHQLKPQSAAYLIG